MARVVFDPIDALEYVSKEFKKLMHLETLEIYRLKEQIAILEEENELLKDEINSLDNKINSND